MPLTENDGRRNAITDNDPLMLIGPDIISGCTIWAEANPNISISWIPSKSERM